MNVSAKFIGKEVTVSASLSARKVNASAEASLPSLHTQANKVDCHWIGASSKCIGRRIVAKFTLITTVITERYLKVDKNIIWVTPDIWEKLRIMSNTEWSII